MERIPVFLNDTSQQVRNVSNRFGRWIQIKTGVGRRKSPQHQSEHAYFVAIFFCIIVIWKMVAGWLLTQI